MIDQIQVDRCNHEPVLYAETFDSPCGERTLYYCECRKCNIGSFGYNNPTNAVRDWYNNVFLRKPAFEHFDEHTALIYG